LQYLEQRESARLADFYKKQNGSHSSEGSKVGYETFAEIANEAPSWAKVGK
jgi:hypothetical protein